MGTSSVEVTCTQCGYTSEEEVNPCETHGEPAHSCELLCGECLIGEVAWHSLRGLPAAEIRKEMGL